MGGRSTALPATLAALIGLLLFAASAVAKPQYATPDPNSPAGSQYALPLQQGRNAGVGSDSHHRSEPAGARGGGGGGGGAGQTGAGDATTGGSALFGAGITSRHVHKHAGAHHGAAHPARALSPGRPASAPVTGHHDSGAQDVAILVLFLLVAAAALAYGIRLVGRRPSRRGAA